MLQLNASYLILYFLHKHTGESTIDCNDYSSPASSFGNIHGFKGKSSESDSEMKFVTKWKRGGRRYTGTLSVQVKPSDMDDRKPSSKSDDVKGILRKRMWRIHLRRRRMNHHLWLLEGLILVLMMVYALGASRVTVNMLRSGVTG